jgi:hypothetical protein
MAVSIRRLLRASCLLLGLAVHGACDHQATPTARPPSCPACECKCACADGSTPTAGGGASREAIAELTDTITRKLAKRDGSCLADVDRLAKLDPGSARWATMYRAQCSMLAGKCDAGKSITRKYYRESVDMLPEQIERSVEALASMYCTGPLDDRGELLRALMTLQKGAYQGNIGIRACTDAYATVVKVRDRVKPIDDEDTQVSTAKTHAHHTAAACLGRAGDCSAAFQVYTSGERKQEWTRGVADPKLLDRLLRDNFSSSVQKCKGRSP